MVSQLTEHFYTGEFLLSEAPGTQSRDTVVWDGTSYTLDTLIPAGTVYSLEAPASTAVATAGNIGNGSVSNIQSSLVNAQTGIYVVTMLSSTTFSVTAPDGSVMNNGVAGTGYLDGIGFQLNTGGTAFVAGDAFNITIANGAAPAVAAKAGGNTGNGSITNIETVQQATAISGNYMVIFTGATTFNVIDPKGTQLATGKTGTYYEDRIGFLITAGGTAFVAGDSFTIGIGTGSGYATPWNGNLPVAGLIFNTDYVPAGGTLKFTTIVRHAEVVASSLQYPTGTTAAQQATAAIQLRALGIIPR